MLTGFIESGLEKPNLDYGRNQQGRRRKSVRAATHSSKAHQGNLEQDYLFSVVETSHELADELNDISNKWIVETTRCRNRPKNSDRVSVEILRWKRTTKQGPSVPGRPVLGLMIHWSRWQFPSRWLREMQIRAHHVDLGIEISKELFPHKSLVQKWRFQISAINWVACGCRCLPWAGSGASKVSRI